jgi:hypothetical protein
MMGEHRAIQFYVQNLENRYWFPPTPSACIMLPYLVCMTTNNPERLPLHKDQLVHSLQLDLFPLFYAI